MTPLQQKLLDFIVGYMGPRGWAPTFAEMREGTGVRGLARLSELLVALEDQGHIRRFKNKARGIELIGQADLRAVPVEAIRAELARRGLSFDALASSAPAALRRGTASCAADCCQIEVEPGHLFCRPHWADLPRDLRDDIWKAFRAKDRARYQARVTEARDLIDGGRYERVVRRAG